jgi:iron(III) transport system permease protein
MISPVVLERPGRWRGIAVAALLAIAAAPLVPSLFEVAIEFRGGLGADFVDALGRSLRVAAGTAAAAFVLGFPCGLLAGLYRFRARQLLLAALALPLLMPSFLWAIGLSMLRIAAGLPQASLLSGATGAVWSFTALGTPLVVFGVLVAVRLLPGTAIDAARLAGGEPAVLRYAGYAVLPVGAAAALLAGIVTLTDPGPGQILGFAGIATQILTSFAALYDFELAVRQGLASAAIVILAAGPLLWMVARYLALVLLAREATLMKPRASATANRVGPLVLGLVILVIVLAPVAGLLQPVLTQLWPDAVAGTVARTAANTFIYALTAGLVATAVGLALAISASRFVRLRLVLFSILTLLFVLPPSAGALGTVLAASAAPEWLDPALRSRVTVGVVLGLRLTMVAALILSRAIGSAPASWAEAAALHGVPLQRYLRSVLAPFLAGPILLSIALIALLATADITTVLLLQPPGQDSLPVALFTVMANAPESLVASLCLAYLLLGGVAIGALGSLAGFSARAVIPHGRPRVV